jgi:hypothetical protein
MMRALLRYGGNDQRQAIKQRGQVAARRWSDPRTDHPPLKLAIDPCEGAPGEFAFDHRAKNSNYLSVSLKGQAAQALCRPARTLASAERTRQNPLLFTRLLIDL